MIGCDLPTAGGGLKSLVKEGSVILSLLLLKCPKKDFLLNVKIEISGNGTHKTGKSCATVSLSLNSEHFHF